MKKLSLFRLMLGICLASSGCSAQTKTSVSGSVTYNGAPVEHGVVTFEAADGGSSFGAPIAKGQYAADDADTGQFKAVIRAGAAPASASSRDAFQQQARTKNDQDSANYIPTDAEGNSQTVEITDGEQTLDFALTGPPRQ
jgi:hypothetical protein